ncbi:extracellular solute-binding protein [Patescibacteria group bacterium]
MSNNPEQNPNQQPTIPTAPPQEKIATPEKEGQVSVQPPKSSAPPPWVGGKKPAPAAPKKDSSLSVSRVKEPIFKKLIPILGLLIIGVGIYFLVTKVILPLLEKQTGGGTSSKKEITLTYWGLWEPETVMKPLIEEYKKTHSNVTINYVQQSHKDYRERLQSALARGEGADIFRFHNTWLPMLQKDLSPAPEEIAGSFNIEKDYFPIVAKNLKVDGKLYGIPLEFDSLALYYNTKIFKTAGKGPPETWEELRRTALDLTVRDESGRIQIAGVALGTASNIDHFSDILGLMMLQNSADLSKPTGSLAEDALKFYTIFVTSDKVWDENLPNSTYAFANEKVAMFFAPSWRAHDLKAINPNLEFKTVPVPQLPDTKVAWASYWVEGVSTKSKNAKAAWEFLNFLSSKESLTKFYTSASQVRSFGEPYPRKDMVANLEDDEIVGAFAKQGSYAESWYLSSNTWDNGINDKMIKYYQDAVNETLETRNATNALKTASQGVAQVLSQYGIK